MNIKTAIELACRLQNEGKLDEAEKIYKEILEFLPSNASVYYNLGIIFQDRGQLDEAAAYYKKALQVDSNFTDAYFNIGAILQGKGLFDEAIENYQKALKLDPDSADINNNLGLALKGKGHIDKAIGFFQKAIDLDPDYHNAYSNLGIALKDKGKLNEAMVFFQKALQINPKTASDLNNLANLYINSGIALFEEKRLDEAIGYYKKALQLKPDFAEVYNSLGVVSQEKGRLDEAITYYKKALQLKPDFAEAYVGLGGSYHNRGYQDEAVIACCRRAIEINPDIAEAYAQLTFQLQQTCSWEELRAMSAKLDGLTRKALDNENKPAESPFLSIIRQTDPSHNLDIAKSWSYSIEKAMSNLNVHFSFDGRRTKKTKRIIGYLSNDLRDHPMGHLTSSLFGLHNKDEFEIFCYSWGKDDGSYYRKRIESGCDKFVDISSLSYDAAARCIYDDQIDILVDLKGWTAGNRIAICALRPAPIQVSYIGFAGSMGADFIDYIIADKIVTPQDHKPYYSEKFVYMPHCYLVNDHTQPISKKEWNGRDFGLPESCFVFCSFNQSYKIDPVIFDIWMSILKQVPESILWLGFRNKLAETHLKHEAKTRGIKPERLIFADLLPKDEHLGRLKLADLALDTRIVNGHTTTSDALWAGVPVITLQGGHFASRVSSSILSAIGLPELITYTLEEYEALAVRLARNADELKEIRQRIAQNCLTEPLFDTPRFVRNLETACKEMWKIFLAEEAPQDIEVLEN